MKRLYYFNRETLKYEKISAEEQVSIAHNKRLVTCLITACGFFLLCIIGATILHVVECDGWKKDMEAVRVAHATEIDSIRAEQNIDKYIAIYSISSETDDITDDEIATLLDKIGAWYPDIVLAQYKIESASGTSAVARNAHNLFGMKKVSGKRKTYTTQERHTDYHGYGVYKNWQMSLIDRVLFERFYFSHKKPSREEYKKMLNGYAEDPEYSIKIENVCNNL